MAPKDTSLALAMVSFILYFNWNWIGLVIPDDDQGNQFLLELKKQSENKEICFAFVKMISVDDVSFPQNTEMYYNQIVMSSTNVIIIYGETYNFIDLILQNVGTSHFTENMDHHKTIEFPYQEKRHKSWHILWITYFSTPPW